MAVRVRELAALAPLLAFAGCPAAHETDDASASTRAEGSESGTGTASESSEGASESTGAMQFALTRFSTTDNPEYQFNDPGVPGSKGSCATSCRTPRAA